MDKNNDIMMRLQVGQMVQTRLSGNSMAPRIKSRQLVTIEPASVAQVKEGDVVFCKVNGKFYLHLVTKKGVDGRVMISNNCGYDNGWTRNLYGKLIKIED